MTRTPPTQSDSSHNRMPSDHIGALVAALVMMIVGWAGLALLIFNRTPRIGAELWLFFILLHLAITGTVLPVLRYFNTRLTRATIEPPPSGVIVRQSVWVGLFVVICAWLQILRVLSAPIAFFLGLVFVVLEVFLKSRENNDN